MHRISHIVFERLYIVIHYRGVRLVVFRIHRIDFAQGFQDVVYVTRPAGAFEIELRTRRHIRQQHFLFELVVPNR